jgi:5-methylcytosine-specific restriction endonuclease McrBC regulatory subunit McrC
MSGSTVLESHGEERHEREQQIKEKKLTRCLETLLSGQLTQDREESTPKLLKKWLFNEGGESKIFSGRKGRKLNEEAAAELEGVFQAILGPAVGKHELLEVDYEYDKERGFLVQFSPSSRVGFVSLDVREAVERLKKRGFDEYANTFQNLVDEGVVPRRPHVSVKPKVEGTQWLSILAIARNWENVAIGEASEIGRDSSEFVYHLIEVYLDTLDELFDEYGGLRQAHRRVQETLDSKVRGRIRMAEFLSGISRGKVTDVPCEYSQLQMDNLPNRTLLWALRTIKIVAGSVGETLKSKLGGANKSLNSRISQLERRFRDVQVAHVTPEQLPEPDYLPGAFRGYTKSGALEVARFIIKNIHLGEEAGDHSSIGFSVDMAKAFEEAFAQLASEKFGEAAVGQDEWSADIARPSGDDPAEVEMTSTDENKNFYPDVYITPNGESGRERPIVADTKWKGSIEREGDGHEVETKISVSNSDLYQIATYAHFASLEHEEGMNSAVGVLVYPTTESLGEGRDRYKVVWDLREGDEDREPDFMYLIPWDVTGRKSLTREKGEEVLKSMAKLAGASE